MSGAPPPHASGPAPLGPPHLLQVLPTARAILWNPATAHARRNPGGAYPLFLEQKALGALHDHFIAAKRQAVLGFLVGDLFECPTSKVRYAVVDSTIRLNQAIYGDKTLVVVSRLWDRIQEELRRIHGHLVGWYHSHPPQPVELAPGDVETHQQYFRQPWHVALVLGADATGAPLAGVFRPTAQPPSPGVSLPFYELMDQEEKLTAGRKPTVLSWTNFTTDDRTVARGTEPGATTPAGSAEAGAEPRSTIELVGGHEVGGSARRSQPRMPAIKAAAAPRPPLPAPPAPLAPPSPPAPPPPPKRSTPAPPPRAVAELPLLDLGEPLEVEEPAPLPEQRPSPTLHTPISRSGEVSVGRLSLGSAEAAPRGGCGKWVAGLAILVLGGAGAGWYFRFGPGAKGPAALPPAAAAPKQAASPGAAAPVDSVRPAFDRLTDSLGQVVARYRDRARLFDARQIECAGLSPGLVAVEGTLIAYSRTKSRLGVLDAPRAGLDQTLTAAVDSVERHYDQSGCDRP